MFPNKYNPNDYNLWKPVILALTLKNYHNEIVHWNKKKQSLTYFSAKYNSNGDGVGSESDNDDDA